MNPTPTEHEESVTFAQWLEYQQHLGNIITYTHLAQETFTKNWGTKMRNKQEGVVPGIPDYIIATKKALIFVEMKRVKGGKVSPAQQTWIRTLNGYEGVWAGVCYGADNAINYVEGLL